MRCSAGRSEGEVIYVENSTKDTQEIFASDVGSPDEAICFGKRANTVENPPKKMHEIFAAYVEPYEAFSEERVGENRPAYNSLKQREMALQGWRAIDVRNDTSKFDICFRYLKKNRCDR